MTSMTDAPIERCIDAERLTRLLLDAVQAFSPSNREGPATEVFATALHEGGLPVRRQPVPGASQDEDRANLIIDLGPEPVGVHLIGHVDTIDLDFDTELKIRRDGDLLYGLGTADMKSGCAAMVEAMIATLESEVVLERGVRLSLVVGEEEYGDGARALVAGGWVQPPLTIIGEPTNLVPCIRHYGYLEYWLAVQGARAHAALPEHGANAIHAILSWLVAILDTVAKQPDAERMALNMREIRGGTGLFVIPDVCEVGFDVHLPPLAQREPVADMVEQARLHVLQDHAGCQFQAEPLFWAPGFSVPPDHPLVRRLEAAWQTKGLEFVPGEFRSHSDASLLYTAGTIPVVCGPGALEVAHTEHEHVSLKQMELAARLYAAIIDATCRVPVGKSGRA